MPLSDTVTRIEIAVRSAEYERKRLLTRMRDRADEIEARVCGANPSRDPAIVPHGAADLRALADEIEADGYGLAVEQL